MPVVPAGQIRKQLGFPQRKNTLSINKSHDRLAPGRRVLTGMRVWYDVGAAEMVVIVGTETQGWSYRTDLTVNSVSVVDGILQVDATSETRHGRKHGGSSHEVQTQLVAVVVSRAEVAALNFDITTA